MWTVVLPKVLPPVDIAPVEADSLESSLTAPKTKDNKEASLTAPGPKQRKSLTPGSPGRRLSKPEEEKTAPVMMLGKGGQMRRISVAAESDPFKVQLKHRESIAEAGGWNESRDVPQMFC